MQSVGCAEVKYRLLAVYPCVLVAPVTMKLAVFMKVLEHLRNEALVDSFAVDISTAIPVSAHPDSA
jgi:hypothetical protein